MMTIENRRLFVCLLALGFMATERPVPSFAQEPEPESKAHQDRTDLYGDALPDGALARLGTVRWRVGEEIDFLAFAAEGKLVVAGEKFGVFHIIDVASGKEVRRLGRSQRAPERGFFWETKSVLSSGGRFLASVGPLDPPRFRVNHNLILGICNWFQVLLKAGLIIAPDEDGPLATLAHNASAKFEDRWIYLKATPGMCPFLKGCDQLHLPVAHGEGNFICRENGLVFEHSNRCQAEARSLRRSAAAGSCGPLGHGSFPP